jgi:hypothetical protein
MDQFKIVDSKTKEKAKVFTKRTFYGSTLRLQEDLMKTDVVNKNPFVKYLKAVHDIGDGEPLSSREFYIRQEKDNPEKRVVHLDNLKEHKLPLMQYIHFKSMIEADRPKGARGVMKMLPGSTDGSLIKLISDGKFKAVRKRMKEFNQKHKIADRFVDLYDKGGSCSWTGGVMGHTPKPIYSWLQVPARFLKHIGLCSDIAPLEQVKGNSCNLKTAKCQTLTTLDAYAGLYKRRSDETRKAMRMS